MDNKTQPRNYSFLALILSLIALVATILLGITRGLVGLGVFTVANTDNLNRYILISAGVVILGLAIYALLEPDRVRRFVTGRQARYGSNSFVMIVAFLGILIVGNVMAFQNPLPVSDLTEDDVNTLSAELLAAVKQLPEKVTATGFFSQNSTQSADQLLGNIKANSNGKFDYTFVNPDLDPQKARDAGVTGDGKILLEMGEYREIVSFASEDEMLRGLLRLLNPDSSAIYFLTGHGEKDTEYGSGDAFMSRASETLGTKNYTVKKLNLLVDNKMPEDASVIVIAGPMQPVSESEVELLREFLANGGSLIVMQDPSVLTEFGDARDPLAEMLAQDWGIVFNNDIVIDLQSALPTTAVAAYYDSTHPITVNMNNLAAYFPFTRSLTIDSASEDVVATPIVQTSERSWGETDFASLSQGGQVSLDATEIVGPLTLAVAAENTTTTGRVVAFGTSLFAEDQNFDAYGSGDMFINSIDWSAEQEDLASITPKTSTERTFNLPSQLHWIMILLSSVFIIPGLVVLGGISTWLARRRQG